MHVSFVQMVSRNNCDTVPPASIAALVNAGRALPDTSEEQHALPVHHMSIPAQRVFPGKVLRPKATASGTADRIPSIRRIMQAESRRR